MKTPKSHTEKTSENALVRKVRTAMPREASRSGIKLGIGDDAALFAARPGYQAILTCDWFLEDTHFLRDSHPADSIGWKSLARAVSDVAAMGGTPRCFLLSLALPETLTGRWLDEFLAGLRRAARKLGCPLTGGDTTRQQQILVNITVIGEVRSGHALLRSGARPGDILYVSGRLGEADFGLQRLRSKARIARSDLALEKHLYPEPRLTLGRWLADHRLATSMMDISDGLSSDLARLCAAGKVGARIEAFSIPAVRLPRSSGNKTARSPRAAPSIDAAQHPAALELALNGGDDYELLFTVRPGNAHRIPRSFRGLPLTAIGTITHQRALLLIHSDDHTERLRPRGWDPFSRQSATCHPEATRRG
jgi:thiamine-monophosphate kinase